MSSMDGITVVVCAWCAHRGRERCGIRAPHSRRWRDVSHEQAGIHSRAGGASHGLCSACAPAVAAEWDVQSRSPRGAHAA